MAMLKFKDETVRTQNVHETFNIMNSYLMADDMKMKLKWHKQKMK